MSALPLLLLLVGAGVAWEATPNRAEAREETGSAPVLGYARPTWSHDGSHLAYVRSDQVPPPPPFDSGSTVVVADADGTGEQDVYKAVEEVYELTWSPVRDELVVNDGYMLVLSSSDGTRRRTLASGDEPSWSPDGKRIAFDSSGIGGAISVVATRGSRPHALTPHRFHDSPAWSPDGRRIAFTQRVGEKDAEPRIATIRADGAAGAASGLRILARGRAPEWSPDGRTIAFVGGYTGPYSLRLVNTSGQPRPRVLLRNAFPGSLAWSPDGTRLLFTRVADGRIGIYVIRRDGTELRRLAFGREPAWSPDGARVAFWDRQACGGRPTISVVDADGTSRRQLTPCR